MDERVGEGEKSRVASGKKPHARPDTERHQPVVNHMKEGNVVEFFPGDEGELNKNNDCK